MMTPKELLDTILGYLGFVVQIEESQNEAGNPVLQIYTEESRRLIGRDGETLEALQFLLNRLLQAKDKDAPKVVVDCEMYRSMREDRIVQRVRELAERVRATGRSLQLEPMNSYERRIVHNAFKDDPDIATWSPSDSARSASPIGRSLSSRPGEGRMDKRFASPALTLALRAVPLPEGFAHKVRIVDPLPSAVLP